MTAPNCIYCGSTDTEGFDIGGDATHVECAACGCAFPTERPMRATLFVDDRRMVVLVLRSQGGHNRQRVTTNDGRIRARGL